MSDTRHSRSVSGTRLYRITRSVPWHSMAWQGTPFHTTPHQTVPYQKQVCHTIPGAVL